MRILIAGCGDIGTRTGLLLAEMGHEVFGLRRDPTGLPAAINGIAADLLGPRLTESLPRSLDACLSTIAAGGRTPERYEAAYVTAMDNLRTALRTSSPDLSRWLFTSSTAVYGDLDGEWIDETTPTDPTSYTGEAVLSGEQIIAASGVPTTVILRLGGIYGPGRTRLIEQVRAGEASLPDHAVYTNRIHADDAARALGHLTLLADPEPVYLGVDNEPADRRDVVRFLAELTGAPTPPSGPTETRSNKRCRNDRLRAAGFEFRYPTYREGYKALVDSARSAEKNPSTTSHPPT